jgi:dihydroorotase
LHITTADEIALFSDLPLDQKHITAEVCAHHLFFNADDYDEKGFLIKCNPAIKLETDRQALLQAVKDGFIDVFATDHAPHLWDEKQNTYFNAPAGLPLVQFAVQMYLEHYHREVFSLELIVRKMAHAVAERYKIKERGYIREGYWADVVLVDLNKPYTALSSEVISKCGWTPLEGYQFNSTIDTTIVSGEIAYRNGKVQPGKGQRIEFGAQR